MRSKEKYLLLLTQLLTGLTAVENKIPDVSNLVKKLTITQQNITDHDHDKYITTPEFKKIAAENFAAR